MTWVVWRRQRAALLAAFGLVAAAAVVVVASRLLVTSGAAPLDVSGCLGGDSGANACRSPVFLQLYDRFGGLHDAGYLAMLVLPVVVGVCAGAGLFARELEQGTAVLALTQSVSRLQWWWTGLLVAGVPAAVVVALLTPVATWGLGLTGSEYASRLANPVFQVTGLVPVAHTLLAFTLAAVGGLLLRSAGGAAVLALVVQFVVEVVLVGGLRRYYAPADELRTPPSPTGDDLTPPGALPLDTQYLDAAGRPVPDSVLLASPCEGETYECIGTNGVVLQLERYHDAAKYWPFQMIEAGLVLAVVAILLGVGARSLRRIADRATG